MILKVYIIILLYFILGGAGFYLIGRNKDKQTVRQIRTKYITYFVIIHILFFSIIFDSVFFHYLSILIMIAGLFEILCLFRKSKYDKRVFFVISLAVYLIFCTGFYQFSLLDANLILFAFLVLSVFDAFSQISGQLMGRTRIFPSISPRKTYEGLAGGVTIAFISSLFLKELTAATAGHTVIMAAGTVLFAFTGDTATSYYKRQYGVKDFSGLIPGHGGFLDRFDSMIAGGVFIIILRLTGW